MGTRHLIAVVKDKQFKIAQYGQWDGYPDGQGKTALVFLSVKSNRKKLAKAIDRCSFLTEEQLKASYESVGVKGDFMTLPQAEAFNKVQPYLSRDIGADILRLVVESEGPVSLYDQSSFAKDSLFCEWAYIVDFDKGTFEVYKGFNKKPLAKTARFFGLQELGAEYTPIRIVRKYKLDKLPTLKLFLKIK